VHPGCQLCGPCRVGYRDTVQSVIQILRQHCCIIIVDATSLNHRECSTVNDGALFLAIGASRAVLQPPAADSS
jgi:hypothetical protein